MVPLIMGENLFSSSSIDLSRTYSFPPLLHENFPALGPLMLADFDGDSARLRAVIDESFGALVDLLEPDDAAVRTYMSEALSVGTRTSVVNTATRLRDGAGRLRGATIVAKPMAPMSAIAVMAVQQDLDHLGRMQRVIGADRRPTAILFADLESSSPLARRLSTANYFALNRRLVRATDQAVIDAGGLVGRHVGDGVVAFFPAVTFSSESAAALACIQAARSIRVGVRAAAERSDIDPSDAVMRFGLHWGATPFIGGITTAARAEVTALGDEINETARIEASATGGRMLASKQLIERLERADAAMINLTTGRITYTLLGDLNGVTDKALRDAPTIAVCEL